MEKGKYLDSWKDIAAYLGRNIRTCRNWERDLGLPVHRLDDSPKSHVFAYTGEIDAWREMKGRLPGNGENKGGEAESRDRPSAPEIVPIRRSVRTWFIVGSVALPLLAIIVAVLVTRDFRPAAGRVERAIKLAVLPFENLSGDPDQESLNDGLTQEMITLLGRLHSRSLGVIARTSVMRYKKTKIPIDQIGRELGVDYVLEGNARRAAGQIRVLVELIQVRDQTLLWADGFEREMTGIQSLQNDVAGKVAGALGLKLLPAERALLASARAVDPDAYEAYFMGRLLLFNKATASAVEKSIEYFRQAIDRDPKYAAAYAGLAEAYEIFGQMASLPQPEVASKQREAAQKALAIDDALAEGHVALGSVMIADWDWEGAEREYKRAIELNPNYANAYLWYSQLLNIRSRDEEALAQIKRARELDPLNPFIATNVLWHLYYLGRYDEAIADSRKLLEIHQDDWLIHWTRGYLYSAKGMYDEAIVEHQKAVALSEGSLECLPDLGYAFAKAGRTTEALKVLSKLRGESQKRHVPAGLFVTLYLGLGERDKAFESLERAYQEHDTHTVWLLIDPLSEPLRSDGRFQDLLKKIGLDRRGGR